MYNLSNGITFNDLEWLLTPNSRSRHFSTLNISVTTRDRAIVTTERQ